MSTNQAMADSRHAQRAAVAQPGAGVGAGIAVAVLSQDGPLLDALDAAVTSDHAIHITAAEESLAELIVSTRCGVAVIDADFCVAPADQLAAELRAQFPELVLIVAGRDSHQAALAASITSGVIYRFLHKPVSTQRVRQFVDAALRRHDEEHADAATTMRPSDATSGGRSDHGGRQKLLAFGVVGLLVLAAIIYLASRSGTTPSAPTAPAPALARPAAADSADAKVAKLLGDAEQALVQNRLSDAATLIDAARALQPDSVRVAFLTGQLTKERERSVVTRARSAAASGNINQALAVLDGSNGATAGSTIVAETRRDLQRQQIDERVRGLLKLAQARLNSGGIATPPNDSALSALDAARELAPHDAAVARVEQSIGARILSEARSAATRGDSAAAASMLKLATDRHLNAADVEAVRRIVATAQTSAHNKELAHLSANANDLIARSRSDETAIEPARTALTALRSFEGNGPNSREAQERFATALLTRTRTALDAGHFDEAQKLISDAQSAGAAAEAVGPLSAALTTQRERARLDNEIVAASQLKRIKSSAAVYPSAAATNNITGWVEIVFTVAADGSVADPKVVNSDPAGVFDKAALQSIKTWRFEPVLRDGKRVAQRARQRIRFALQ